MKHIVMMVALSIFFFLAGTACGLALPLDVHDLSFAEGKLVSIIDPKRN